MIKINFCSTERALMASVLDDPDDDTVRLAYADWLSENDRETQATQIRDGVLRGAVRRQAITLPVDALLNFDTARHRYFEVRRGFVTVVGVDWRLRAVLPDLLRLSPIREVEFIDSPHGHQRRLFVDRLDRGRWRLRLRERFDRARLVDPGDYGSSRLPVYAYDTPTEFQSTIEFYDREKLVWHFGYAVDDLAQLLKSHPQYLTPTFRTRMPFLTPDRVEVGDMLTDDGSGRLRRWLPGERAVAQVVHSGTESLLPTVELLEG